MRNSTCFIGLLAIRRLTSMAAIAKATTSIPIQSSRSTPIPERLNGTTSRYPTTSGTTTLHTNLCCWISK